MKVLTKSKANRKQTTEPIGKWDEFSIEPTTQARLVFILKFVPMWMKLFRNNDWEVAQRLAEEVNENFQFKPIKEVWKMRKDGKVVSNAGQFLKDESLCHIIVQQTNILKFAQKTIRRYEKMFRRIQPNRKIQKRNNG